MRWLLLLATLALADDDDHDDDHGGGEQVAPVANATYAAECGSCHFAYPPGLLPGRSWTALLADLPNHFGDDATVSDPVRGALWGYLTANAADAAPRGLSGEIARATAGTTPLRISAIPALKREHDEIPAAWVLGNPDVRSFAACASCHTRAADGSFREREIRVPGHGRWED